MNMIAKAEPSKHKLCFCCYSLIFIENKFIHQAETSKVSKARKCQGGVGGWTSGVEWRVTDTIFTRETGCELPSLGTVFSRNQQLESSCSYGAVKSNGTISRWMDYLFPMVNAGCFKPRSQSFPNINQALSVV